MRKYWPFIIGAVVFIGCGLYAHAEPVDGVVATVGPEVILQSEIMQEIGPALNDLHKNIKDPDEFNRKAEEMVKQALDQAIEYKILLREATLAGIDVKDEMVEARIEEIKKRFKSNEEFLKELEKAGETMSDFRTRVRKQSMAITMGMRKHREYEKAVEVTEADVSQYFQENQSKLTHPERVQLRRIFLAAGTDAAERTKVKARMEELRKQAAEGADFAELARKNSTGPEEASKGGLMGWVNRKDLVKGLDDAAFSLPEGGISNVLETDGGCVLLKVEKKEAAGSPTLDQARKQIEPELRTKFATEKYNKWMFELRKRSRVRVFL